MNREAFATGFFGTEESVAALSFHSFPRPYMIYCPRVMKMPRAARKLSSSNIYHVMLRGINRQNIFEDDEDRLCFMQTLARYKKCSGFRLYAFVLMSNHVHLLIEPADEPLDMIFRRIGVRYAVWFNQKYERVGHLFQDRFRSENVETDAYFMTVLRYIIQNPAKAGMESAPGSYRWSSFLAYEKGQGTVTDTQFALDLFGGRDAVLTFLLQENKDDSVLDEEKCDRRLRDDLAKEKMARITRCTSVADFQQLDAPLQKEYARRMHSEGMSLGQISRMTGMPKTSVYHAVQALKKEPGTEEEMLLRESAPVGYLQDTGIIW